MSGAVVLEVDDGFDTELGPGDVVVQRGTMHRWRNPSDTEVCRIVFVLIEPPPPPSTAPPSPRSTRRHP